MLRFLISGGCHYDWTSPHKSNFEKLLASFKDRKNISFLEIGCYEGNTSRYFLETFLSGKKSTLTCIEPAPKKLFYRNCAPFMFTNKVKLLKELSIRALSKLIIKRAKFDFIYIDGSHLGKNVFEDSSLAFNLLKEGGIMLFDDYGLDDHRVVDDYFDNSNLIENYNVSNTGELPMFDSFFSPKVAIDSFLKVYSLDIEVLFVDYQVAIKKLKPYCSDNLIKGKKPFCP